MSSTKFTPEELAAFREEYCKGASDTQFDLFISEAVARNLRPGPHLFFQLRSVNEWDSDIGAKVRKSKATWMSTIAAFRLISQRSGKDAGRGKTRWIYLDDQNLPTVESTIPLPHRENPQLPREPFACVVPIYRSDYKEPIEIVCRFEAYAVTVKTDRGPILTEMWQRRGPEQLEKCSECASRRAAYPEELGSLFIPEEFKNEVEDEKPHAVTPASVVPPPPVVPKVDQTPAQPTNAPRPGENFDKGGPPNVQPAPEVAKTILESLPILEKFLDSPQVQEQLAKEGKKVDHEELARVKAAALAAVPDLKPASELPPPEKKKRGPKAKSSPDNGRDIASEGGITDADIKAEPLPETNTPENKAEAQEFVASLDPTPTSEERKVFATRVRALSAAGPQLLDIQNYLLAATKAANTKEITVNGWNTTLSTLEAAQKAGTLKEVVKNAPLPAF